MAAHSLATPMISFHNQGTYLTLNSTRKVSGDLNEASPRFSEALSSSKSIDYDYREVRLRLGENSQATGLAPG